MSYLIVFLAGFAACALFAANAYNKGTEDERSRVEFISRMAKR